MRGHRVWLRFADGSTGEVDLSSELHGPVFVPLRDPSYFAQFTVDETLTWPNGADIAPETLYELATGKLCELCVAERKAPYLAGKPAQPGRGRAAATEKVVAPRAKRRRAATNPTGRAR